MKRILLIAAAVAACAACKNNTFVIEGELTEAEGPVYLYQNQEKVDSTTLSGGRFSFRGTADTPVMGRIATQSGFRQTVFLEPGTIVVTDQGVSGTPSNDAYGTYDALARQLIERYRAATDQEEAEAAEKSFDSLTRASVDNNRTNLFGAMLFADQLTYELTGAEILAELDKFPQALRQSDLLAKVRAQAETKIHTDPGQPFIEIELPDREGHTVALSEVVGNPANRYVLVDFWASWCGPCMGEVPYLVETYGKYRDKGFEIYGISLDKSRDAWLAAVDGRGMEWIQVSPLAGFDTQAVQEYAVQGIPANFLIDTSTGRFVATNLRGAALEEKVAELLGR